MEKNFDAWNERKKTVHRDAQRPFYHAREIWWCSVGVNIGNEIDGTGERQDRPVLVICAFNAQTFFGVCLIGHDRQGEYYFPVGSVDGRKAVANLSQVRLFDTKRLIRKIETLDENTFDDLCDALSRVLFSKQKRH